MSGEDILKKFDDILSYSGLLEDMFRTVGGWIVKLLLYVNDGIETVVEKVITTNDFYKYGQLTEFRSGMAAVVWALLALTLVLIGYQLIFNKIEKRSNVILNGLLAFMFIISGPLLMDYLNKLTSAGVNAVFNGKVGTSGEQIVKNNLADIDYYVKKNFKLDPPDKKLYNNISPDNIRYINFTEPVDDDLIGDANDDTQKAMKHKITIDSDNKQKLDELNSGLFKYDEKYYRWHINWFTVIISLLVAAFTMIMTIIKLARLTMEMGFHNIFGMLVAATDISGGQRLKKILNEIFSTYAVVFCIALLLKIYTIFTAWTASQELGTFGWGNMLLLIGGSWLVIDGPNIVERLLGIDAGLQSGWKALTGTAAALQMAGSAAKGGKAVMDSAAGKIASTVGAFQGMRSAWKDEMGDAKSPYASNNGLGSGGNSDNNGDPAESTENEGIRKKEDVPSPNAAKKAGKGLGANNNNKNKLLQDLKKGQKGNKLSDLPGSSRDYSTESIPSLEGKDSADVGMTEAQSQSSNEHIEPENNSIGLNVDSMDSNGNGVASMESNINNVDRGSMNQEADTIPETVGSTPDLEQTMPQSKSDQSELSEAEIFAPRINEQGELQNLNDSSDNARNNEAAKEGRLSRSGNYLKPGHIEPTHYLTPLGQTKTVQNIKNQHAMGYNGGYDVAKGTIKAGKYVGQKYKNLKNYASRTFSINEGSESFQGQDNTIQPTKPPEPKEPERVKSPFDQKGE
ncbi:pLS20_p028 family conjugation system transmembrane protein [Bacillus smithii]|uniref:pLS20_p028 family conjugation system transmembrane protein n=1 Tax=Bacillus smithii TaxID=1479 RepID=UPI002E205405|nr:hypothetical protein [Bacillus smithii]MED4928442.1 hypothetical protein [Bacillus smithii]